MPYISSFIINIVFRVGIYVVFFEITSFISIF